jgi:glycosyltransferase involved in cell wall biosynthesis
MIKKRSLRYYVGLVWLNLRILARLMWLVPSALVRRRSRTSDVSGKTVRKRLLFLYSQVPWHEVWQRPQEIASRLCEHIDVVFFSPVQAHRRLESLGAWKEKILYEKGTHRLLVLSPLILSGHYKNSFIFKLNSLLILADAHRALSAYDDVILLTNSPFVDFLAEKIAYESVVYDVIDEFAGFGWAPPTGREMERRLLQRADLVFTGTYSLLEKKRALHPNVHFVPCGVRFEMFNRRQETELPKDLEGIKKPILGYTGSISERLDTQLIAKLASAYPHASIVLIGPLHGDMRDYPQMRNIFYLGLKRHDELPLYVQQFDIALIPFRLNEASRAVNPVKTLEYLAAGKPVLSTAIPDVERFYADCVAIAYSHDEFIRLADSLLNNDNSARIEKGIDRARSRSWDTMAKTMWDMMSRHSMLCPTAVNTRGSHSHENRH